MNEPNKSIECTVNECRYHCGGCDYCSLDAVQIGAHTSSPDCEECVDCRSFKVRA